MVLNPHAWGFHKAFQYALSNSTRQRIQHDIFDARYIKQLQHAKTIMDIRHIAQQRAHQMIFDYMDGGADDEYTLTRNQQAYQEYEFIQTKTKKPQQHDINTTSSSAKKSSLSTNLFGHSVDLPFFSCPTAGNKMFHVQGEEAVAQVAYERGTVYVMSSLSTTSFDDINKVIPTTTKTTPKVFQLYVWKDRDLVKDLLHQAKSHGFTGLALTVDATWMGNRERDVRNGFSIPPNYSLQQTLQAIRAPAWTWDFITHDPYSYACINQDVPAESLVSFINRQLTPDFSWKDAEWLLGEWTQSPSDSSNNNSSGGGDNYSVALKGVVRPQDAIHAVEMGFSTIWISNHGGRQLDTAPATLSVLPSMKEAVKVGNVTLIIDGGIQSGADIATALALGADGVGIGKPYLWGLCAGGYEGVNKVFQILQTELEQTMQEWNVASIGDLKVRGRELLLHKECDEVQ
ncbi:glycolate oxidase [Nitzschia inconspicua]|uniref:Glycolate oxidase n=1 Tax=Nitzschia inconspicua TaxID=303405 RepID=A0A9K3K9G2_9STRA|nr:glycolate oxidase [Nitzschia inconspicua]KAG7362140.1 glycolate oxidase [Nitzschia inconspicua]